jgi:hypothetical protein
MHAALELITAVTLIAVPFAIGMSFDAAVTAAVIGIVLFGLALSATGDGRGSLPVSAHAAYDAAVAFVLVGSAVVFGLSGELMALAFLLAAGVAQLTLNALTRYAPTHA